MRVITQDGYVSLQALELLLNEGLLSVKEWEHAVIDIYLSNQVDTGNLRCDNNWTHGCKPAKWAYLDEYSTVEGFMWGYLCESCAEGDKVEGHSVKLLTPVNDGVYCPDVDIVIRANWNLYNRKAVSRGTRVF